MMDDEYIPYISVSTADIKLLSLFHGGFRRKFDTSTAAYRRHRRLTGVTTADTQPAVLVGRIHEHRGPVRIYVNVRDTVKQIRR